jgi:hypothetical protein
MWSRPRLPRGQNHAHHVVKTTPTTWSKRRLPCGHNDAYHVVKTTPTTWSKPETIFMKLTISFFGKSLPVLRVRISPCHSQVEFKVWLNLKAANTAWTRLKANSQKNDFCVALCHTAPNTVRIDPNLAGYCHMTRRNTKIVFLVNRPLTRPTVTTYNIFCLAVSLSTVIERDPSAKLDIWTTVVGGGGVIRMKKSKKSIKKNRWDMQIKTNT